MEETVYESENEAIPPSIIGMMFESRDSAWDFYKKYAANIGFSARRATTRKDAMGNVRTQEFCCSRAGFRKSSVPDVQRQRAARAITRTGCTAKIVVSRSDSSQWCVIFFRADHNHPLCPPIMQPFLRSNREVNDADIIEARSLKNVSVRTSQVMNYFTQQSGGFQNVGFTRKDLYNSLQTTGAAEIIDGDVNALLAYFDCKKDQDSGFYMQYTVDESMRLHNIFWCDSTSKSDYSCFGDVIAFDTTYKDNAYGRPLMSIVGVNHHHQTIIFSFAILADETADTFEWVLRAFLDSMFNKAPVSVVTDGDRAMQRVIKIVFPLARHRICSWHLSRNAQANIGDKKFTSAFTRCMSSWWTIEEFDREWSSVVEHFNVQNHPWVVEKDRTQHLWAQAYITGHFFAEIRSTQRCEGMNAALAVVLKCKKTYIDVVRAIENTINEMRIKELKEDFFTTQSKPRPSTKLIDLEGHAAEVYTRTSFAKFQDALKHEMLYRSIHPTYIVGESRTYHLTKYKDRSRMYEVVLHLDTLNITCSCRRFESVGLSCPHQLHVIKLEDFSSIPNSLILPRWTKNAKISALSFMDFNVSPELKHMSQFACLRSLSTRLCFIASQTKDSFRSVKDEIVRLTSDFDDSCSIFNSSSRNDTKRNVRDPGRKHLKRKQNQKIQQGTSRTYNCSFCNLEGHNKNTCPRLKLQLPTPSRAPTSTDFEDDIGFVPEEIEERNTSHEDYQAYNIITESCDFHGYLYGEM